MPKVIRNFNAADEKDYDCFTSIIDEESDENILEYNEYTVNELMRYREENKKSYKSLSQEDKEDLRKREWALIESLVLIFQEQFSDPDKKENSDNAANQLLDMFSHLFKKYVLLIKSGYIDFDDKETKAFVISFMDEEPLKKALRRRNQKAEFRDSIHRRFKFIKETYGTLPKSEILLDLNMLLLVLAKRYKPMGKSFCGYIYNCYRFEVSRHIKKFTKDPFNIHYRQVDFEDCLDSINSETIEEEGYQDCCENEFGMPDLSWITGGSCSDVFQCLTPLERKMLIKYYLEDWNDKQIAAEYSIHINTCNHKRRLAVSKLADALGIDESCLKRSRKSGKKAAMAYG